MTDVSLRHHDAAHALEVTDQLAEVYVTAYIGTPQGEDPFYSRERFIERFAGYTRAPGFELVTAHADGHLIGYVFGYTLPTTSRWWDGLITAVPSDFTTETGSRTFAINELHVRQEWRGHGIASDLHAELRAHRPEQRLTILVRLDNPARSAYLHWGYRVAGKLKPYPDSPTYDALILDAPSAAQIGA